MGSGYHHSELNKGLQWEKYFLTQRHISQGVLNGGRILRVKDIVPQATGNVMEIGIGTGCNLPFYKEGEIKSLIGIDQQPRFSSIEQRSRKVSFSVDVLVNDIEEMSVPSESMDSVVSTFTLCAVNNPLKAMMEIRRVLKPGGLLIFCEPGRHPSPQIAWLQDRFTPFWQRISRGCRLNRNMFRLIVGAGFQLNLYETDNLPFQPFGLGYQYAGVAVKA